MELTAMGLDKVVENILRRGEERKQEILRQGEQERDATTSQTSEQIEEHRKKSEQRTASMIAQMEQQELSSAELESKKSLLSAQRQVMEDLKAQVLSDIAHYPDDKKIALYGKLIKKARSELGDCYVYSNASDKGLLRLPPGMMDGGAIECKGGLVFESKDRSVRLDYRFESMLEDVWDRKIQEIYTSLFG
jgi:V/A-type H+-transporting ATPase subunit E